MSPPPHRSLADLAASLAAAGDAEAAVFELVGSWVQSVPEPSVKVALSIHSRRHGEHCLELGGVTPRVPSAVPGPAFDPAVLAAAGRLASTGGRLAALACVLLPRLVALAAVDPGPAVSAAPVARALRRIEADHREMAGDLAALVAGVASAGAPADREAVEAELAELARASGQELRWPPSNLTGSP